MAVTLDAGAANHSCTESCVLDVLQAAKSPQMRAFQNRESGMGIEPMS